MSVGATLLAVGVDASPPLQPTAKRRASRAPVPVHLMRGRSLVPVTPVVPSERVSGSRR